MPQMDVGLMYHAVSSRGLGHILLRDMVLVNAPFSQADYPSGMLTSLPWYVGLYRCVRRLNSFILNLFECICDVYLY